MQTVPDACEEGLVDALLVASRALVGVAARSLADVEEITLPQYRALVVLAHQGSTTVTDLATALDVHSSTTTRLCDRLVRKGLVRRTPGEADRRSIELHLEESGRRLVERVTERRRRDLAAIVGRVPADVRPQAVEALRAFAEAAGEPGGVDHFGWDGPSGPRSSES